MTHLTKSEEKFTNSGNQIDIVTVKISVDRVEFRAVRIVPHSLSFNLATS